MINSIKWLSYKPSKTIKSINWVNDARKYKRDLFDMLYPQGACYNARIHGVSKHPIYNFLHTYYQYSFKEIEKYSAGMHVILQNGNVDYANEELLNTRYAKRIDNDIYNSPSCINLSTKKDVKHIQFLKHNHSLLKRTSARAPFFGCFGLHEWAMVYDPNYSSEISEYVNTFKQQKKLNFRVSQSVINGVIDSSNLRCTHFDAWRFFQDGAQQKNKHYLQRHNQVDYEQPGCIHANMDLFKFAVDVYPLIPSSLLLSCLELSKMSRTVDIRASPYDVSHFEGCEVPIEVETNAGRQLYIKEQEKIYKKSIQLRQDLLTYYDDIMSALEL